MTSRELSRFALSRLRSCRNARRVRRIAAADRRAGRDAANLAIATHAGRNSERLDSTFSW